MDLKKELLGIPPSDPAGATASHSSLSSQVMRMLGLLPAPLRTQYLQQSAQLEVLRYQALLYCTQAWMAASINEFYDHLQGNLFAGVDNAFRMLVLGGLIPTSAGLIPTSSSAVTSRNPQPASRSSPFTSSYHTTSPSSAASAMVHLGLPPAAHTTSAPAMAHLTSSSSVPPVMSTSAPRAAHTGSAFISPPKPPAAVMSSAASTSSSSARYAPSSTSTMAGSLSSHYAPLTPSTSTSLYTPPTASAYASHPAQFPYSLALYNYQVLQSPQLPPKAGKHAHESSSSASSPQHARKSASPKPGTSSHQNGQLRHQPWNVNSNGKSVKEANNNHREMSDDNEDENSTVVMSHPPKLPIFTKKCASKRKGDEDLMLHGAKKARE